MRVTQESGVGGGKSGPTGLASIHPPAVCVYCVFVLWLMFGV